MKKVIIIALSLAALNVAAQDIIVMRNGDEVEAKVTKVGKTEVEYHKWSNQDGPVYTVAKSDVFMVKYKNGEKDVFDNVTAKSDNSPKSESNSSAPQYVEAVPAANNQELISIYNKEVDFVAIKDGYTEYYQVADTVMGADTLDRELKSLNSIRDHNPKYLLTMDNIPNVSHNGIKQLYALDWLLDK